MWPFKGGFCIYTYHVKVPKSCVLAHINIRGEILSKVPIELISNDADTEPFDKKLFLCSLTNREQTFIYAYQKDNFLVSQPKHMLRVLKRTVSIRRFF